VAGDTDITMLKEGGEGGPAMALRDIFDSDPRSKDQLRAELRVREKVISDLSVRLNQLEASAFAANQTIVESGDLVEIAKAKQYTPSDPVRQITQASIAAQQVASDRDDAALVEPSDRAADLPESQQAAPILRRLSEEEAIPRRPVVDGPAVQDQVLQLRAELAVSEKFKAILRFTNSLHRVIAERLLADLSQSKLEIVRLCDELILTSIQPTRSIPEVPAYRSDEEAQPKLEDQLANICSLLAAANLKLTEQEPLVARLDAIELENVALKKAVGPEVWRLRRDVEQRDQEIASQKYHLDLSLLEHKAQEKKHEDRAAEANKKLVQLRERQVNMQDTIDSSSESVEELEEEICELKVKVNALEAESNQVASRLQFHINSNSNLRTELARYKQRADEKKYNTATASGLDIPAFKKELVLAWMFSETHPDDLRVDHGYSHSMGDGPWDNAAFGRLMEGQDFSLWPLPDADVAHLVVGRKNWRKDELVEQIEARQGQPLRIYSQEMWFAAMATGRDPFDANDPDLLQAFAKGHDALEFLIGYEFPWPDVSDQRAGEVTVVEPGELGVLESPMRMMDYRVGKTSPHSEEERHKILNEIFSARSLIFGDDCSPTYRSNWGTSKSAQRLYRMATHIKTIADRLGNDYRKPVARADWISDLAWLKKAYFKRAIHGFKWPDTTVP
jgi:hypothetical protein